MKTQILTFGAALSLLLLGSSPTQATLRLRLDDGNGNVVAVTDNGAGDINSTVGVVTYAGAVGPNWYLNVSAGTSKPVSGSASSPELDLNTLNYSSGAGSLEVELSDTDFSSVPPVHFLAAIGGNTTGTVTYDTWADSGNGAFAETSALTSQGPFSGLGFNESQTDVQDPLGSPYSLTLDTVITHTAAGQTSFDAKLAGAGSSSPIPALTLVKTASTNNAVPGQVVTYYYAVTNTGNVTITNINIWDDNGTPNNGGDDFIVNAAPFSLNPGQGTVYALPSITEPLCMPNGGTNLTTGTLTVNVLANGNVEVFYLQSPSLNDNRYGTGATAATGWPGGHSFSQLTGSDEADFLFADKNGNKVLQFQCDYISAATGATFGNGVSNHYASGYGTLGPKGGDGTMQIGSLSNVLSCSTTLSDTLNQPGFTGYIVNSPPETSPLSGVSIPAGWNYVNGYHVIVSSNAFGAAGFGSVSIPYLHNSPAKAKPDKVTPTNVCDCVVNTAQATAYVNGALYVASLPVQATVCFPPTGGSVNSACNITPGALKFDKKTIQLPMKNNAATAIYMSELDLSGWPAANGKLISVSLNGVAWTGSLNSPVTLTLADFVADANKRKIDHGQTKTLVLTFQNNVDTNKAHYSGGTVKFGTDASCSINFLP
jgi:hypothetical protein